MLYSQPIWPKSGCEEKICKVPNKIINKVDKPPITLPVTNESVRHIIREELVYLKNLGCTQQLYSEDKGAVEYTGESGAVENSGDKGATENSGDKGAKDKSSSA